MSFASDAKRELCKALPAGTCCQTALAYGMLLFARSFSPLGISLTTENRAVSELFVRQIASMGYMVDTAAALVRKKGKNALFTVSVPDEDQRIRLLQCFGHTGSELNLRINRANLENECCVSAFLRGAFLTCGTVTDPNKDYHLEFAVPHHKLARDLATLLSEAEGMRLEPGMVNRKGAYVVYLKGSESITDLLAFLGANNAAMDLMQVKMLKEVRNYVNRTTNFQTANISKTASAAARQLEAIQRIQEKQGLDSLPEELRELAKLRLEYPEMSLRELGEALSEPISRSGVNHRLNRLIELAEDC